MDFSGKAVLITGSSSGIGKATAIEFAKNGASFVGINYLHAKDSAEETKRLVEAAGSKAVVIQADVSNEKQAGGLVESFYKEFGRLDILVSNAGTTEIVDRSNFDALTTEVLDRVMHTNLYGPFFCTRAASKIMKEQGSGNIVIVASIAAVTLGGSSIPYNLSKVALLRLVELLTKPLSPEIRINCVCPGTVSDSNWFSGSELAMSLKKRVDEGGANSPLKRNGMSLDYAKAILFFASEQSEYCTGSYLVVDGGFRVH